MINYEEFVKKNKIVKSATYELIPVPATREAIREQNTIESDKRLKEYAKDAKLVGDAFYRDFAEYYATQADFDWTELKELFTCRKINRDAYSKAVEKMKADIVADVHSKLQQYINMYAENNCIDAAKNIKASSTQFVDVILLAYARNEKNKGFDSEVMAVKIEALKGTVSTTFKKYFVAWEKVIDGIGHGSIAGRMIENFEQHCINMTLYEQIVASYPEELERAEVNLPCSEMLYDVNAINKCFSQKGIDDYNGILAGVYSSEGKRIADGINIVINELRQQKKDRTIRPLSRMKKQILTLEKPLFAIESIGSVEELKEMLHEIQIIEQQVGKNLYTLMKSLHSYECDKIFIGGSKLNSVSQAIMHEWDILGNLVKEDKLRCALETKRSLKGKPSIELTEKEIEKVISDISKEDYTFTYLNQLISHYAKENNLTIAANVNEWALSQTEYICKMLVENRQELSNSKIFTSEKLPNMHGKTIIRNYLDAINDMGRFVKNFSLRDKDIEYDYDFYEKLNSISQELARANKIYNMVRNFLTKKPKDSVERTQLCFGRAAHFEQKWANRDLVNNKFGNVDAAILEKDGKYYYIVPGNSEEKRKVNIFISDEPYEGENYHYLTTIKASKLTMAVPKATFKSAIAQKNFEEGITDEFEVPVGNGTMKVSKQMYDDYNNATFRTSKESLVQWIDYYKAFLKLSPSYNKYDFSFLRPSDEYKNLGEFCNEVDSITYSVKKRYLNGDLDKAVAEKEIFMFLISNADMYKSEDRIKDATSLYFREIMKCMDTGESKILLNNSPTIYYRPTVIEAVDMHPKGSILVNKKTVDGKYIPGDIYMELSAYYNGKVKTLSKDAEAYIPFVKTKGSDREHIKDKHYCREMFTITISYTLNMDVPKETLPYELNQKVQDYIRNGRVNVMTVIRGVASLLYYVVADEDMNIIESGDLNTIGGTNFYEKLKVLGDERKREATLSWTYDKTVASLKDTYLGMAASEIVKIALKHNAIICIDNVSDRQKDSYSAFDTSMYKKFEGKLVNKLCCYTDASIPAKEPGGLLNPLQLAVKDGKGYQNGILFYITAQYTRNVCYKTGFVNLLKIKGVDTIAEKRALLQNMNYIRYDESIGEFAFAFTYGNIGCNLTQEEVVQYNGMDKEWIITIRFERYRKNKKNQHYEDINGTSLLAEYFMAKGINYWDGDIDVSVLDSEGVSLLFEMFILYANGYYPMLNGMKDCIFYSPVCAWSNTGKMRYDEMTAYNLTEKCYLSLNKYREPVGDGKKAWAFVSRVEWLNHLMGRNN